MSFPLSRTRVPGRALRALAALTLAACSDPGDPTPVRASVADVVVTPATATLQVGASRAFAATPRDAGGAALSGRAVGWGSSAPAVLVISADGTASAVAPGTATVTATVEGKSGRATVTVVPLPGPAPVSSVAVTPATAALLVGATQVLSAVTRDSAGGVLTGRVVTWSSLAPDVATVSAGGVVTALAPGSATITATAEGKAGSAVVTVAPVPVATVAVTPAAATLLLGGTEALAAVARDSAGAPLTGRPVTWTSSAPAVATVGGTGVVTAVAVGSATVTATVEGRSATAAITVVPVPVATVAVSPAAATLQVGATQALSAVARDSAGGVLTGRPVTWSSSAPAVATVSGTGVVTAVAAGSATISATVEGRSASAAITVTAAPAPVASVSVTPALAIVPQGATRALTVTLRDTAGAVLTNRAVTWSSGTPAIATVSASGVVSVVGDGRATISAVSEGISGTAIVGNTFPGVGGTVPLAGAQGALAVVYVEVPAGKTGLSVTLAGAAGADPDLYVYRPGAYTVAACESVALGATESCDVTGGVAAGTWAILVYGYSAHANTTLTVTLTPG